MPKISAILQNFRGQCPRVRAFSHVCILHILMLAGGLVYKTMEVIQLITLSNNL